MTDSGGGKSVGISGTSRFYPRHRRPRIIEYAPAFRVCTLGYGLPGKRLALHTSPYAQACYFTPGFVSSGLYTGCVILPTTTTSTGQTNFNTVKFRNLEISGSVSIVGTAALNIQIWNAILFVQRDGYHSIINTTYTTPNLPSFSQPNRTIANGGSGTTAAVPLVGQKPFTDVVLSQQGSVCAGSTTDASGQNKKILWNDKNVNIHYMNLYPGDQLVFLFYTTMLETTAVAAAIGNFYLTLDYICI